MKWNENRITVAFEKAKKINAHYGKSYFFASRLFPKEIRNAVHILYAFFRLPDEMVDSSPLLSNQQKIKQLIKWEHNWKNAYQGRQTYDDILYAAAYIFHYYHIPFIHSVSFLDAMKQDIVKNAYETYEELEKYMYGSAGVVGIMLSYIIGFKEKKALEYAVQLGYAMQLTNFLRDIKEDWVQRQRIYMPHQELKQFQLSPDSIMQEKFTPEFAAFIAWQIKRIRQLYRQADIGIQLLNHRGRLAVTIASRLYEAILNHIEKQRGNVFMQRAKTSLAEKMWILFKYSVT